MGMFFYYHPPCRENLGLPYLEYTKIFIFCTLTCPDTVQVPLEQDPQTDHGVYQEDIQM